LIDDVTLVGVGAVVVDVAKDEAAAVE